MMIAVAASYRAATLTAVIIFPRLRPVFVLFLALFFAASPALLAAEASITIDAKTGFILEKFQPDKKRQIGSVTKIASAMVVLDWASKQGGDLAQVAIVPETAFAGSSENNISLQPGDT